MKTRVLLFLIFTVTIFGLGTLITVLFNTAPTSFDVLALFYGSLFTVIFGLAFMFAYTFYYFRNQITPSWTTTVSLFRLSILSGLLVTSLLLIQAYRFLNGVTFIVLIIAFVIIELVMRRRSFSKQR